MYGEGMAKLARRGLLKQVAEWTRKVDVCAS